MLYQNIMCRDCKSFKLSLSKNFGNKFQLGRTEKRTTHFWFQLKFKEIIHGGKKYCFENYYFVNKTLFQLRNPAIA